MLKFTPTEALPYLKPLELGPSELGEIELGRTESPVFRDLGFGIGIFYAVDQGDALQLVQERHLVEADLHPEDLHSQAVDNLAALARDRLSVQGYGAIYAVFLDGNFEATLILLDALWDIDLADLAPSGFAAAIPARDILAFCDVTSAQGLTELRALIERLPPDADHPLTPQLISRRGGNWAPFNN